MLITLLTDFGIADYFVGAMKGAILSVSPRSQILDITHEIPPQDIRAGAFTLLGAYPYFPARTIHVAVVDPGVGSSRRPILVAAGGQFFVGPDNGLFGYVYERETEHRVYHLNREQFFHSSVSTTFHGRDVFAPVAGALAEGKSAAELGQEIKDYVRLAKLSPRRDAVGSMSGEIIHIDRFGNCITNLSTEDVTPEMIESGARLVVNGREIKTFRRFYAEEDEGNGASAELFAIWGSAGLLEIAARDSSAAHELSASRGQTVRVIQSSGHEE
ncbi:MAG TPA: SAM-dependent chlorinase/fluorinase [Pyrinomonadaceae bacterium]|jgi:S-adenosylmethionine hydrolase|nr:SAM-dependent chlorinase/fluorinase [Pyrinomonadaceae bacterium]